MNVLLHCVIFIHIHIMSVSFTFHFGVVLVHNLCWKAQQH